MEGTLEALIGALLAIVGLKLGMDYVLPKLSSSLQFLSFYVSTTEVLITYAMLVVIGVVIGLFGSAMAMRRYLKV